MKSFIQQNAQFLSHVNETNKDGKEYECLEDVVEVVVNEADRIKQWFDFLKENRIKPDSIRGRLHNVSILLQQFVTSSFRTLIPPVLVAIKPLIRKCAFDMKQKISSEDMVDQGLLPKKGKTDLIDMWKILCPLLDDILLLARQQVIGRNLYILAMQILFFGFYSEKANVKQLCDKKYYTSKKTKSVTYRGKQLVCLGHNSDLLSRIQDYVRILRPQVTFRKMAEEDSEHVFLQ